MKRLGGQDKGSVLVDALVAIGVMTLTMVFAAETVGAGALRTRAGERSRMADLEARSRMAEVGGDIPLVPGSASGEDDDMVWTVDVAPAAPAVAGEAAPLLEVTVTVAGSDGARLARLHSLRVGGAS
jgi:hypothetical protein